MVKIRYAEPIIRRKSKSLKPDGIKIHPINCVDPKCELKGKKEW